MKIKILSSVSLLAISTAFLTTVAISCGQPNETDNSAAEFETIISNLQRNKFLASSKIKDKQVSEVIQQINEEATKDENTFNLYIDANVNFLTVLNGAKIKNFVATKINENANEIYVTLTMTYKNIAKESTARITITSLKNDKNDNNLNNIAKNWYDALLAEQETSAFFKNKDESFLKQQLEGKTKNGATLKTLLLNMPNIPNNFSVSFELVEPFDSINGKVKILVLLKDNLNKIVDTKGELNSSFTGKEVIITGFAKNDNNLKNMAKNWYDALLAEQETSALFKNKDESFLKQQLENKTKDGATLKTLLLNMSNVPNNFSVSFELVNPFDYVNGKVKILVLLKNNSNQIVDTNGDLNSSFTGKEIIITGFAKNEFSEAAKLWYQSLKVVGSAANAYPFNAIYKDKYSDDVFGMISSKDGEELFKTLATDIPAVPAGFSASLSFDDTSFNFKFAGFWIPKLTLFKTNDSKAKYNQDGNYDPNFAGKYIAIAGLKSYTKQMFTDFWFSRLNQPYEVLDELKDKTNDELVALLRNKSNVSDVLKNPKSLPIIGIQGFSLKFGINAGQDSFGQASTTGEGIIYLFLEDTTKIGDTTTTTRWVPSDATDFEKTVGKTIKVNGFTIKK